MSRRDGLAKRALIRFINPQIPRYTAIYNHIHLLFDVPNFVLTFGTLTSPMAYNCTIPNKLQFLRESIKKDHLMSRILLEH